MIYKFEDKCPICNSKLIVDYAYVNCPDMMCYRYDVDGVLFPTPIFDVSINFTNKTTTIFNMTDEYEKILEIDSILEFDWNHLDILNKKINNLILFS